MSNLFEKISIKSLLIIAASTFLFAFSVNLVLLPNHMGEGGVTGISMLVKYVFGIEVGITYFVINAIILFIGFKELDKITIVYTLYSLVLFTFFVSVTSHIQYRFTDTILTTVVGGVLLGIAIGFILLAGGSTAGTDIIVLIIRKYFGLPSGVVFFIIDILIITPGIFVIGVEKSIYTIIMLYISTRIIDYILEGLNPKKSIMIISEKYEEIAETIMKTVDRGITILDGKGYYTKQEKQVLYIVVNRGQVLKVNKIAQQIDPKAFITISDVHSVTGEGFTFH